MIQIDYYMNDGACMQAQCVLAYLRNFKESAISASWNSKSSEYEAIFYVGRYENCREQGYVFSVYYKGKQINFAVYEHRNSDEIHIVQFEGTTLNTPTMEHVTSHMKDKYDTTKSFKYMQIEACGDYIITEINNFINKIKDYGNDD